MTAKTTNSTPTSAKTLLNKKWVLKSFPKEKFIASRDAELVEEEIDLTKIPSNKVVIKIHEVSIDAFIRTMLDDTKNCVHGGSCLNQPLPAQGYGSVIKTANTMEDSKDNGSSTVTSHPVGTLVLGLLQAASYAILDVTDAQGLLKFSPFPGTPPRAGLGLLGISGITAYMGTFVSPPKKPQRGDTVVVSAAAGAVGCIAAQMAKLCGAARVVGIAGGEEKCRFLTEELKLDGAVDYKKMGDDGVTSTLGAQLDKMCPDGIDFFFDNVGGETLDEVLKRINKHSRIVICGAVSQYDSGNINNKSEIKGPSHYIKIAETSSSITGFNAMHYEGYFLKAIGYLAWHYYRGNIVCPEHIEKGIESFGNSVEMLFSGGHKGRLIVDFLAEQQ